MVSLLNKFYLVFQNYFYIFYLTKVLRFQSVKTFSIIYYRAKLVFLIFSINILQSLTTQINKENLKLNNL